MTNLVLKPSLNAQPDVWTRIQQLRQRDPSLLAPKFRDALEAALAECARTTVVVTLAGGAFPLALDALCFETLRTDELQAIYYQQHVTNAATARHSWHFYGLAADIISARYEWFDGGAAKAHWPSSSDRAAVRAAWFRGMGAIAIAHGLDWGGTWHQPDLPHIQWGKCFDSPQGAPGIYDHAGGGDAGRLAVWRAVGAC